MDWYWGLALGILAALVLGMLVAIWLQLHAASASRRARELFFRQREHLEAKFFTAASSSGKPRGLRWLTCDWERDVEFGRDRRTGKLAALAAVTIRFEAVEGSDMEGLPAVGNLRPASAVFFFDRGQWHTTGKTVFNLSPAEAIQHFKYERVAAG
jgi:hypothetical protein